MKEKDLETQMNWHKQGSEGGRPRFTEQPGASSLPQTLRQSPSHPSSLCRTFRESSPTSQSSLSSLGQRRPSAKADHQSVEILTTTLTWKKKNKKICSPYINRSEAHENLKMLVKKLWTLYLYIFYLFTRKVHVTSQKSELSYNFCGTSKKH